MLCLVTSPLRSQVADAPAQPAAWSPYPEQDGPHAGEDCAVMYDPTRRRMILFGGKDDQNTNLNELWLLDLATSRWSSVTPAVNPPPTEDHVMIHDPLGDRAILHGGESDEGSLNSTWSLDLETLTWREITSPDAPKREDHTAIYDAKRKRMVIFGGRDDERVNLTDLSALDLDPASPTHEQWTDLEGTGKKVPQGRIDHVAISDPVHDRMVIFGGWDKDDKFFLGDTWALSFADMKWKRHAKKTKSSQPCPRRHAVAVYDDIDHSMIVMGGIAGGLLNDIWRFDLVENSWSNLTPGPPPRMQHVGVFDHASGRVIVYGGEVESSAPKLHDAWFFQNKQ